MTEEQDRKHPRGIKTYVVRGGRLTASQEKALTELWPRFGLNLEDGLLDQERVFGRKAPLVFEIGFGMGGSLLEMAQARPDQDYIGVDVHPPGVGTLLKGIQEKGLENIRVYKADALEVLKQCIAPSSLDNVQIFFPDPWHKKRHHKRRMIQPDFVALLREKLKLGGSLHLATDWQNYSEYMLEVMEAAPGCQNRFGPGQFATSHERPKTKFERRGEKLGHGVWDLIYIKNN